MASKKIPCQRGKACPFYKGGPCIFAHPEEESYQGALRSQAAVRLTVQPSEKDKSLSAASIARTFAQSLQVKDEPEREHSNEQFQEKEKVEATQLYKREETMEPEQEEQSFEVRSGLGRAEEVGVVASLLAELKGRADVSVSIKGVKRKHIAGRDLGAVRCEPDEANALEDYEEDIEPYLEKLRRKSVAPMYVPNADEVAYRFEEQPNMNAIERLVVFHWFFYSETLYQALAANVAVEVKVQNCCYTFKHKDSKVLQAFAAAFREQADACTFLKYQTYDQDSLKTLSQGLLKIEDKMRTLFQQQDLRIDSTAQIKFHLFTKRLLLNYAKALASRHYVYIALRTQKKFEDLQVLMCKLVDGCFYRKLTTQTYRSKAKIKNVDKKTRKLNQLFRFQQILVSEPELNQWDEYEMELKVIHWVFDSTLIDQEADSRIKIQFQRMFLGQQCMRLKQKGQVKIWREWLEEECHRDFDVQINEKKSEEALLLWIDGEYSEVERMMEWLQQELDKKDVFSVGVPLADRLVVQIVQHKLRYSAIFKVELGVIESRHRIRIRINSKSQAEDKVEYLVIASRKQEMGKVQQNLLEFTKLLRTVTYSLNKQQLFEYLQIAGEQELERQYDVVMYRTKQSEYVLFGLQHQVAKMKDHVELFLAKEAYKVKDIKVDSKLVWEAMYARYYQAALKQHTLHFDQHTRTIQLRGSRAQTELSESSIQSEISRCRQSLKLVDSGLSECEVNFLARRRRQAVDALQDALGCECIFSRPEDTNKVRFCLEYESRKLILTSTKLVHQKADCIVNPCCTRTFLRPNLFSGVARDVSHHAGIAYQKECKRIVKSQSLKPGDFFLTASYGLHNCPAILNANIPHYTNGTTLSDHFKLIDRLIKAIWALSKDKIKHTLAIPVIGSGSHCFFYSQIAHHQINSIIKYSNANEIVYLVEEDPYKMQVLVSILETLTSQSNVVMTLKHQWQWHDGSGFRNYDDWEIVKQIDVAYQSYARTSTPYRVQIDLPFTKQPGTHLVDLERMQLVSRSDPRKVQRVFVDCQDRLYFDNQLQSPEVTEYVLSRGNAAEIFLYSYIIDFTKDQQINSSTGTSRKVRRVDLDPQFKAYYENLERKNALTGVQFHKSSFYDSKDATQKSTLHLYSRDVDSTNRMKQELHKMCKSSIVETYITIPKTENQLIFQKLVALLQKETVLQFSIIHQGQNLKIRSFDENIDRITRLVDQINKVNLLPKAWSNNTLNYNKTRLTLDSPEYLDVFNFYRSSFSNFRILDLNRIENKTLYEQYHLQQQRILAKNKSLGYSLAQQQKEKLTWHLVENNDPEIISQVGFHVNLKNQNQCGEGVYFTDQPKIVSNKQEKVNVFCCKICTGRLSTCSNGEDYDTIEKQNTIVLSIEEIHKAYPAYELILKKL